MMEDTMEAYRGAGEILFTEVEKVYFILDGDDDPVQEADLNDVLYANGPFPCEDE